MSEPTSIQKEIQRFEMTKKTFQNCERLLRTCKFAGSECEQVAQCIALIKFMVNETNNSVKELKAQAKKPKKEADITADESGLGLHLPDSE